MEYFGLLWKNYRRKETKPIDLHCSIWIPVFSTPLADEKGLLEHFEKKVFKSQRTNFCYTYMAAYLILARTAVIEFVSTPYYTCVEVRLVLFDHLLAAFAPHTTLHHTITQNIPSIDAN